MKTESAPGKIVLSASNFQLIMMKLLKILPPFGRLSTIIISDIRSCFLWKSQRDTS